jgi:hypothetical protein
MAVRSLLRAEPYWQREGQQVTRTKGCLTGPTSAFRILRGRGTHKSVGFLGRPAASTLSQRTARRGMDYTFLYRNSFFGIALPRAKLSLKGYH